MTTLNKNHASRLKTVDKALDKALDSLKQSEGLLWPRDLRSMGRQVAEIAQGVEQVQASVQALLSGSTVAADPAEPDQEGDEDVAEVAEMQPVRGMNPVDALGETRSGAQLAADPLEPSFVEDIVGDDLPASAVPVGAAVGGRRRRA